jgi:hypothetical protein
MMARAARRGSGNDPVSVSTPVRAAGPDTRTTATPDGGGPLDSAKMVSLTDFVLSRCARRP